MAGEWREVTLGEIAELVRGVSYRPADLLPDSSNGIPLLRATNIRDGGLDLGDVLFVPPELVQPNQMLRRYDVVIAMSSGSREAVGRLAQLRQDWIGCVGAFCAVIRADPRGVHPDFLGFVLQSPDFRTHVETHAVGTAIMNLSRERILGFSLKLPPLPEQRAIAHILGTLDDKIELNRRMSETLEAMARALFKAWFVDFEPVRAKMEGRWQRGQSLPGLPAHLYDLFPDRLVDSELGEIPEGWSVGTLAEIVELVRDHVNPLSEPASEFLHFSIPAFDEGQWPKLERGEEIKSQKWQVPPGVVLLSKLNPEIERVWLVDVKPDDRAVCSTEFLVLQPKPPYGRAYVYCLTRSPLFRQQIKGLVTGTSKSHQRAQPRAILELAAIKPSAPVVPAFDRAAASLLDRTLECRRESRTLAALRDALLPKLIRGEIRVKDAEQFLKERVL
jgi:type I restriction enzyme S subunit